MMAYQPNHVRRKRSTTVRKSTIYLFVLAFVVAVIAALTSGGLVVSAQNSNSSTTMTGNENKPKPSRRGRRGTRKTTPPADEATPPDTTMSQAAPPTRRYGRCDPTQQEQTDLSGTYTGKVRHGGDAAMDATLTITGNNFTMTTGSETHSGRITAVTTCGYTAVTVMHGDMTPPAPGANPPPPNKAMSLRAKKVGNSLTLTSVPGEPEQVMFTTGGGAMRPRRHRSRKPVAPPPPTE
jgi:hypothetical protein